IFDSAAPSNTVTALCRFTPGDHATSVPTSPTKMNALVPVPRPCVIWKPLVPLNTMPVGAASPALPAGIETTSDCAMPLPSYSVAVDVPLFATQTKPAGLNAIPHGFTRSASTFDVLYGLLD